MAQKILNVECGKRVCKVALSEKKGKAYQISTCFTFATPEGAVVDGQIVNTVDLAEKLKTELSLHIVNTKNIIFSVTSSKIATREVSLPIVKEEQIKNVILTNIADYFPIDTSKYKIDTMVLSKDKKESRVLVVACPIAIIDSYTELADVMGCVVEAIDFSGNSQYQVLKGFQTQGVNMYISVDPDTASVVFMEDGKLLMQRAMAIGGDEMICRYMASREMMDEDYIKALEELSVSVDTPAAAADTTELQDCLNRLVMGLSRSVDYFRNGDNSGKEIERVVLLGACSHLAGFKEQISKSISDNTFWIEEVPEMQGLANRIDSISVFISCLGANVMPMKFLTDEYLKKTGRGGKKKSPMGEKYGLVVLIAGVLIAAALVGTTYLQNRSYNKELSKTEKKISELLYAEKTYNDYLAYQQGDKELQAFIDGAKNHNEELLSFFEELEKKMPSAITILTADCTTDGVSLSVEVPSFDEAAIVIRNLRSFKSIDVITVSSMNKMVDDSGRTVVSFTVNCAYPVPEEETTVPVTEEETTTEESK